MYPIERLRVGWSGGAITGPGLSTFYFLEGQADPAAVVDFFEALAPGVAPGITWDIPGSGDVINAENGDLTGTWAVAGGGSVNSSGTGDFVRGAGLRIVWNTGGIFSGRRVRGSTFVCPLWEGAYDGNGNIASSVVASYLTAATDFQAATAPNLVIWSRQNDTELGKASIVTSARVPSAVSWLRSRRT